VRRRPLCRRHRWTTWFALLFLLLSALMLAAPAHAVTLVISNVPPEFSSVEISSRNRSLVVELRVSDYNGWKGLYKVTVEAEARDGRTIARASLQLYETNTSPTLSVSFANEIGNALDLEASWVAYTNESLTVVQRTTLTAAFELAPLSARWLRILAEDRGGLTAAVQIEYPGELLGVLHPVPDLVPLIIGLFASGLLVRHRWIQLQLGGPGEAEAESEDPVGEAGEEVDEEGEQDEAIAPASRWSERWSAATDLLRQGGFSIALVGFLAGFTLMKALLLLFRVALETPGWAAALTPLYESEMSFEQLLFLGFLVSAAGVLVRLSPTPSRLQLGLILAFVSLYGLMLSLTGAPALTSGDEIAAVVLVLLMLATMPLDHSWSLSLERPELKPAALPEEEEAAAEEGAAMIEEEAPEAISAEEMAEEVLPEAEEEAPGAPLPAAAGLPGVPTEEAGWGGPLPEEWRPSPVLEEEAEEEAPREIIPEEVPPEPVSFAPPAPVPAEEPAPEAPPLPEELAVAALETEARAEPLPHIYLLGCPFCGYLLSTLDARCERCGFELTRWTRLECPICGELLAPNATHCPSCGSDLDDFARQVAETYNTTAVRQTILEQGEGAAAAAPATLRGLRCPFCGTSIAGEEESCPSCQVHFLPEMFVTCTDCGARYLREQARCDICGAPSPKPPRPGPVEVVKEVTQVQRAKVKLKRQAEVRRKQIRAAPRPPPPARPKPRVPAKAVAKPAPRRPPPPPPPPPPPKTEKARRRLLSLRRRKKK